FNQLEAYVVKNRNRGQGSHACVISYVSVGQQYCLFITIL
ncbi:hypothetical protein Mgra_00009398, partial [Meloidogyne graminicola]